MEETKNKEEQEPIHTEQIQDIIGTPPRWLYRWGITFVLAIAAICIFISSLIDYPEAVQTHIKILSTYSPYVVSFKDSARLNKILVQNDSPVKKGDSVAIIETATGKVSIIAPVSGKLTYAGIIHENEQLAPNQHLFFISDGARGFYGEMIIPQNEAYRVKPGQTVLVKFKNPFDEKHSTLKGTIKYITGDQLKNELYFAEANFDNLKNNEAGYFFLRNGMIADAEIITAKATLLHRLIKSLTQGKG